MNNDGQRGLPAMPPGPRRACNQLVYPTGRALSPVFPLIERSITQVWPGSAPLPPLPPRRVVNPESRRVDCGMDFVSVVEWTSGFGISGVEWSGVEWSRVE